MTLLNRMERIKPFVNHYELIVAAFGVRDLATGGQYNVIPTQKRNCFTMAVVVFSQGINNI